MKSKIQKDMDNHNVHDIYDRIFKRIFNLSNLAIINLINGLFSTNYLPDSKVEYPNKEMIGYMLDKHLADVFVNIDGTTYHLEAQMAEDGAVMFRAFEYEFHYAINTRTYSNALHFPEPVIIYLDTETYVPETSTILLDFGKQGTFEYKIKNFIYQDYEVQELNRRKLVILIPFQLLKLRKLIANSPTKENFDLLQNLIRNDIFSSIKANLQVGNITAEDATQLKELTWQLYDHIYKHYEELGGYDDMKPLLDGAIELPLDKYRIRIDELEQEKTSLEQEKTSLEKENTSLEQKNISLEEENRKLRELLKNK